MHDNLVFICGTQGKSNIYDISSSGASQYSEIISHYEESIFGQIRVEVSDSY